MITIEDLTSTERRYIVQRMLHPSGENVRRRRHVRERYLIMRDKYEPLLRGWITDVYREPDVISELSRHALPLFNPPRRAVDRLAVAYAHAPIRRIGSRKTATKSWLKTLDRSHFNLYAREWNRAQVAYNTVVIVPIPRPSDEGDLYFDFSLITGAIAEIVTSDGRGPFETPDILVHTLQNGPDARGEIDISGRPVVRTIDSEWFAFWNANGDLVDAQRHGIGFFPGALIRNTIPDVDMDSDEWWHPWVNLGAFRAMRATARIVAALDWTRKTQCRKLIAITADGDGVLDQAEEEGEVIGDPEATYKVRDAQVAVHDLDQAVGGFREHIRMYQDEALEVMTGAIATLSDPDPQHPLDGAAAAQSRSAIMLHRRAQAGFLMPADLRLQRVMAAWMTRLRHPDALSPELVKAEAEVMYPPLPFVEDSEKRLNWYVLASKFGIVDQVMAAIEFHGWGEDEALENLKKMAERKAELAKINVEHQTPNDPTQVEDPAFPNEDLAARQGRAGGQRTSPPSQGEAAR